MSLHYQVPITCSTKCLKETTHLKISPFFPPISRFNPTNSPKSISSKSNHKSRINTKVKASKAFDLVRGHNHDSDSDSDTDSENKSNDEGPIFKTLEEREEMRRKIREMIDAPIPPVNIETDPAKRKEKRDNLLKEYNLVVDEEDPDWPEENDEGWGFNFDQFFNKISIKHEKDDDDDEDEEYHSDQEIVWKDDDYIKPIDELTSAEWEQNVFIDFNPLVILVHHRYKRPKVNEKAQVELVKAIEMFWQSNLPSPRCAGIDACVERKLVKALNITTYPEILFTKNGKILHRDKMVRTAEEWAKIMGFFYYNAKKPPCLDNYARENHEKIPSI